MANYTYTKNIPLGTHTPAQDYSKMQVNTNSTNDIIAEDHISFNNANGGFHTVIRQYSPADRTRSGVGATTNNFPAATVGINKVFSAFYTPDTTGGVADTQLFTITGGGDVFQLTGNKVDNAAVSNTSFNDGHAWIGGILIQWGYVNTASSGSFSGGHAEGTVTFKDRQTGCIPFPNSVLNISCTPFWTNSAGAPSGAASANPVRTLVPGGPPNKFTDKTQFDWVFNTNSSDYRGFTWIAIGY